MRKQYRYYVVGKDRDGKKFFECGFTLIQDATKCFRMFPAWTKDLIDEYGEVLVSAECGRLTWNELAVNLD